MTAMEDRTRPIVAYKARKVWPVKAWLEEQKRERAEEALIQCGKAADLASKLAKKTREVVGELVAKPPGLDAKDSSVGGILPSAESATELTLEEDVKLRIQKIFKKHQRPQRYFDDLEAKVKKH